MRSNKNFEYESRSLIYKKKKSPKHEILVWNFIKVDLLMSSLISLSKDLIKVVAKHIFAIRR